MKKNKVSHLRFARNLHAFQPTRMTPAFAFRGQLLRRILGVIYQYIRSLRELPKILVKLREARLIVGSVDYRPAGGFHAISQASLWMVQESGGNLSAVDFPFVAAADFMKFASRRHHADFYGEVWTCKLRFKHLSKSIGAEEFRMKTIKVEAVLRLEKRVEEGNPLDVIPMVMRDKNVGFDSMPTVGLRPTVAEHSQSRATVQNKRRTVGRYQFQTRRIAAIAPCIALKRRRRAAHSPEGQFGNVVGHRRRES